MEGGKETEGVDTYFKFLVPHTPTQRWNNIYDIHQN